MFSVLAQLCSKRKYSERITRENKQDYSARQDPTPSGLRGKRRDPPTKGNKVFEERAHYGEVGYD